MIPVVEGREVADHRRRQGERDSRRRSSIAKDYNLKVVIAGGAEAWMLADKLAAAKVPVLTGAMNNIPGSFATLGSAAGERRDAAQGGRAGGASSETRAAVTRMCSTSATFATRPGTRWRTACRGMTRCARSRSRRRRSTACRTSVGSLQGRDRGERRDLEWRSVRVRVARGAGVRSRQEARLAVAAGHAGEAVQDASAEVRHALRIPLNSD